MPFKVKYLYKVHLGYKRAEDQTFSDFKVLVLVPSTDQTALKEKAKALMLNWPGRTGTAIVDAEVYETTLIQEVY